MPNNPIGIGVQSGGGKAMGAFQGDSTTALATSPGIAVAGISGTGNRYNITGPTLVKATPGRAIRFSVIVAGTSPGSVNDCATTGAAAVGNQVAVIPNTIGVTAPEWPCTAGIVVVPGSGQTVAISFS